MRLTTEIILASIAIITITFTALYLFNDYDCSRYYFDEERNDCIRRLYERMGGYNL